MRGGYQLVASTLNMVYDWPDGRVVSRQAVEAWHLGRVLNQARQLPPSPVEVDPEALRTQPTDIFETDDWVEWVRPGVRGARGKGWVVPLPHNADVPPGVDESSPEWQDLQRGLMEQDLGDT